MGKTGKDQSGEKMGNQKKDLESINRGRRGIGFGGKDEVVTAASGKFRELSSPWTLAVVLAIAYSKTHCSHPFPIRSHWSAVCLTWKPIHNIYIHIKYVHTHTSPSVICFLWRTNFDNIKQHVAISLCTCLVGFLHRCTYKISWQVTTQLLIRCTQHSNPAKRSSSSGIQMEPTLSIQGRNWYFVHWEMTNPNSWVTA